MARLAESWAIPSEVRWPWTTDWVPETVWRQTSSGPGESVRGDQREKVTPAPELLACAGTTYPTPAHGEPSAAHSRTDPALGHGQRNQEGSLPCPSRAAVSGRGKTP
ncbi:uncharacterized protein O9250_016057 [Rhynochetos jubatus]